VCTSALLACCESWAAPELACRAVAPSHSNRSCKLMVRRMALSPAFNTRGADYRRNTACVDACETAQQSWQDSTHPPVLSRPARHVRMLLYKISVCCQSENC
jgi:hypothetical protein